MPDALLEASAHLRLSSYFLLDALRPDAPALFERDRTRVLTTSLDTNVDPAGPWDGDSFDAGFLYGWIHGSPLEACLTLATACGSLSTRAASGTVAQPTLQDVRDALPVGWLLPASRRSRAPVNGQGILARWPFSSQVA